MKMWKRFGLICFLSLCVQGQAQLPPSKAALKRPLVSLTFDDGWSSIYDNVYPLLDWYNYPATFYIFTNVISEENRVTADQLRTLHQAGHEIGAHSLDHADLSKLLPTLLIEQLVKPQNVLQEIIQAPVVSFAVPFGKASPTVVEYLRKYYRSNRSVLTGFNSKVDFDRYNLKVQAIFNNTKVEDVEKWVDSAMKNNFWLILEYHQVDHAKAQYGTTPEDFENHLKAIRQRGLTVVTVKDGVNEVMEQIAE
jgi:peptidoglycan/xylan/chitin deacetylase (PgdA/CDA1 family)